MKLYQHQQDIITEDRKKTGLWLGTGTGKTRTALLLAKGKTLVIAPKTQVEDRNWQRELTAIHGDSAIEKDIDTLTVLSKETFRRDWEKLPAFDTIIVDEAHTMLGVLPVVRYRKRVAIPKASQLFEALDNFIHKHKPTRFYLCTATVMRSPMAVWAAGKLLGTYWDYYKFRSNFYVRLPMPGREVWQAKNDHDTKKRLAKLVRDLGHVGRLDDYFDVPAQTFKTIRVELTKKQADRIDKLAIEYPDPLVLLGKMHQVENGVLAGDEFNAGEYFDNAKLEKILELAAECPRMVIFAKYKAQIRAIETTLRKEGYTVFTLTGDTPDRGSVIAKAAGAKEGILIAQAQISAGWELPEYPVMIFASMTYSWVDYDQSLGRIQRANNIKKNLYIKLVVRGGIDEAVEEAIANKQDFNEKIYLKNK